MFNKNNKDSSKNKGTQLDSYVSNSNYHSQQGRENPQARTASRMQKVFRWMPLLVVVGAMGAFLQTCTATKSADSTQIFLGLNEPLWPNNSEIAQVTYNTFNDDVTTAAVIKTEDQEKVLLDTCNQEQLALDNKSLKNLAPEQVRIMLLKQLTCAHFYGALQLDKYWSLRSMDVFTASKARIQNHFELNGENFRAKVFGNLSVEGVSITNLRDPLFYDGLSGNKYDNLISFCQTYFDINPKFDYFAKDFEYDNAQDIMVREGCLLMYYFQFEKGRIG